MNRLENNIESQQGFTLLELMVVLVILALLATVVAPNVLSNRDKALGQKARADIGVLEQAIEMYRMDNFRYPTTDEGLAVLLQNNSDPESSKDEGYIKRLPKDPWNHPYHYLYPGKQGAYDIYSLGLDGVPGGEGLSQDIGNWDAEEKMP